MARKREDAEDLVQDATLCAFRAFDSFRMGPNFKAWFFRILTNCFISKQRSRRVAVSVAGVNDAPQLVLFQKSREGGRLREGPDSAEAAHGRLEAEQDGAALRQLPEEYRLVLTMEFVEDFRSQDVAAVLDGPVETLRSGLHPARRMLQMKLRHIADDNGAFPRRTRQHSNPSHEPGA